MKDPLIGSQIAHYRIESVLGKGGMGKVYKAQNLRLAKTCAIKVLPPEALSEDPTMADRFVREARAAAAIEHPNVLPVHNVAKVGENFFIEMQYVDGGTLFGLMRQKGRLDVKEAARIIRDVAAALQAAHEKGIIHRDMKPTNVMLSSKGHVFVMDFGLAKVAQASTALTQKGYILGTPLYMSPEQATQQPLDHRSDIYSLGVMFYQVLTGTPPYTADSPVALLLQHKEAPIPDITQVLPDCPLVIAAVIRKMMAKDPAERYQSCAEVVNDLNAFLASPPGTMVVTGRRPTVLLGTARGGSRAALAAAKKRSPAPLVLALVLLLVLVLGSVAYFVVKGKTVSAPPSTPATEAAQGRVAQPPSAVQPSVPSSSVGVGRPQVPQVAPQPSVAAVPAAPAPTPAPTETAPAPAPAPAPSVTAKQSPAVPPAEGRVPQPAVQSAIRGPQSAMLSTAVDLLAYLDDIKPINGSIDTRNYDGARSRAALLKEKYPGLIETKLANIERIAKLRARCIERVNSGAAKLSMGDVSKRYAFAGEIKAADDTGLTAAIKKGWDALNKDEIASFYRKASDPASGEDCLGIAAFLLEGTASDKDYDQAMEMLGKAKELKTDVSALLSYVATLQQAQKEYAEAAEKGKALEGPESAKQQAVIARSEATKQSHAVEQESVPPASSAESPPKAGDRSAVKSFDDVYVATAATGDKIPHPLSKKTTKIIYQGKRIDCPEGMVFVPAGEFLMGEGNEPPNGPEHRVYLDAFFIGKYEVTNAEFKAFVEATSAPSPSNFPKDRDDHPVVQLDSEDCEKYCEWVSRETGWDVNLPTEAQWEKAARGVKRLQYPWGNDWNNALCNAGCRLAEFGFRPPDDRVDWYPKWVEYVNARKEGGEALPFENTSPVGSIPKGRSPYGCFDMAGNASEWCRDWFQSRYYSKSPKKNPQGPSKEEADYVHTTKLKGRVLRGGGWPCSPLVCRAYHRRGLFYATPYRGFRVVVLPSKPGGRDQKSEGGPQEMTESTKTPRTEKEEDKAEKEKEESPSSAPSAVKSFDDVYVAAAATGDKIPHPLSKKTSKIIYQGKRIDVPEGMVYVPAGEFTMGEKESEHKVYLDAFFIGKYEVTNAEWKAFVDATNFMPLPGHWKGGEIPQGKENHAVVSVSWDDAQEYCKWASDGTARKVGLPTEAQWEKAARGPKAYEYPWGNTWDKRLCNSGWSLAQFGFLPKDEYNDWKQKWEEWKKTDKGKEIMGFGGNTTPVGSFPKSKCFYGCYDMAGNAYEWCQDWFMTDYYKLKDARKNPEGPTEEQADEKDHSGKKSKDRVLRGGSWTACSGDCRTVDRFFCPPYRNHYSGFRVVVRAAR